jgi:hypothetical protein
MNSFKEEWMEHASMLIPSQIKLNDQGQVEATWDLPTFVVPLVGLGLAALDGPLPFMDAVATLLLVEYLS